MFEQSILSANKRRDLLIVLLGIIVTITLSYRVVQERDIILYALSFVLAVLIFLRPFAGLLIMVATIPLESVVVLGGEVTLTRIVGIVVFGSWIVRKIVFREKWNINLRNPFFILAIGLFLVSVVSLVWARFPADGYGTLIQYVQLILFSLLITDLTTSWKRVDAVYKALIVAGLIAVAFTIGQYVSGNVTASGRAGTNISGGLNNTAAVLATIIPFALYLIRSQQKTHWRILGVIYVTSTMMAITVTFSRTAFLMIIFVFLLEAKNTIQTPLGRKRILLSTMAIVTSFIAFFPSTDVFERTQTIAPTIKYAFTTNDSEDPSNVTVNARGYIYRIGWRMYSDHPLLGVGVNNFSRQYLDYQFLERGPFKIYTDVLLSSHSSYLSFLTELGLGGLALWIGIFIVAGKHLRSAREFAKKPKVYLLIAALSQALMLQVIYGFAARNQIEKLLWLIFGLAIAVEQLSQRKLDTEVVVEH